MAENVIINESNLKQEAASIERSANELEDKIQEYISILEFVSKNAVVSGKTATALKTYISHCRKLRHQTTIIGRKNKDLVEQFLNQVQIDEKY